MKKLIIICLLNSSLHGMKTPMQKDLETDLARVRRCASIGGLLVGAGGLMYAFNNSDDDPEDFQDRLITGLCFMSLGALGLGRDVQSLYAWYTGARYRLPTHQK